MYNWVDRGQIPADAAPVLMAIAEDEEVEYSAADFRVLPVGGEQAAA